MASNEMQLQILALKKQFPEIPEEEIISCFQQCRYDYRWCIQILNERRSNHIHRPMRELDLKEKGNEYWNKHFEVNHSRHVGNQNPAGVLHGVNGNNLDYMHNQNYNPAFSQRMVYPVGTRSSSVSGVPSSAQFQRMSSPSRSVPQTAPVVSYRYRPFLLDQGSPNPSLYQSSSNTGVSSYYPDNVYDHQAINHNYDINLTLSPGYAAQVLNQRRQMNRLLERLQDDRKLLHSIVEDVRSMEQRVISQRNARGVLPSLDIQKLREETQRLRQECDAMTKEVDNLNADQKVPLGITDQDFYKNIHPGQTGSVAPPVNSRSRTVSSNAVSSTNNTDDDDNENQWSCPACTFLNNSALYVCEVCTLPRFPGASGYS